MYLLQSSWSIQFIQYKEFSANFSASVRNPKTFIIFLFDVFDQLIVIQICLLLLSALLGSSSYGLNMLFGSVVGMLQSRLQTRIIMMTGCALSAVACLVSSFVRSIGLMFFTFSLTFGVGSSMAYTPTMCLPQTYFRKYLSLATGIMVAGSSSGTLFLSPVSQWLTAQFGWRYMFRVFAAMCTACVFLTALIAPPPVQSATNLRHSESRKILSDLKIWKNRVFIIWATAITIAMFGFNTPGVHLVSFIYKSILALSTSHKLPFIIRRGNVLTTDTGNFVKSQGHPSVVLKIL